MIASHLSASSRAVLALVCKRFYCEWKYSVLSNRDKRWEAREAIRLPMETPDKYQIPSMSKASEFRPQRWRLLQLLERDVSEKWLLCHDCFILHPVEAFDLPKKTPITWLKKCYNKCLNVDTPRSCRRLLPFTSDGRISSYSPSGYVDLCPCKTLTPGKRDRICVMELSEFPGPYLFNHKYLHSCHYAYGNSELYIWLHPFVPWEEGHTPGNGNLHYRIHYHFTRFRDTYSKCSRMTCPHVSLDRMVVALDWCRFTHGENRSCDTCRPIKCCPICETRVLSFERTRVSTEKTTYIVYVQRRLDNRMWGKQVVFPYARQRQYEKALEVSNRKARRLCWF